MKNKQEYIGKQFNEWTVLEILPNRKLKCQCSCGKIKDVAEYSVISGKSTNCGHSRYTDIKGKIYGELTVLEKSETPNQWICRCSCGRLIEATKYELECGRNKCCSKHSDVCIIGQKFNKLTVVGYRLESRLWTCKCECGEYRDADLRSLRSGNIKSCTKCSNAANNSLAVIKAPKKHNEPKEPKDNLVGMQFGDLKVIDFDYGTRLWNCKCSCGADKQVKAYDLINHKVSSCGHNIFKPKTDLTGKTYNSLHILSYIRKGKWDCLCSCGKHTVASTTELINGYKKSCGCKRYVDLTGNIVGELTVIGRDPNSPNKWLCKCSCGNSISLTTGSLGPKGYKSCGHIKKNKFVNLLNQTFGELTVTEYLGHQTWLCRCSCGNTVEVLGHNLRRDVRSCGCKTLELYKETMMDKYGDTSSKRICNPREDWQIEVLENKQLFEELILTLSKDTGRCPSSYEVAARLNVTPVTAHNYADKYNIKLRSVISSFEDEIKSIFPIFSQHNREILNGLELDFYSEEHKLALEFNGNYWHSTVFKDKLYHQNKTIQCAKQGIRLIHIFEYEWLDAAKREKLINLIRNAVDIEDTIVLYGRDTIIHEISKDEADVFLINYHLDNTAYSSIQFGCFYNEELIGVITFGKPRFNHSYEYEIIRMAWKTGYRVIGGTQKLFNSFIKKYKPNSVVTYCDISKFTGNTYSKLGFSSDEITKPNYVWVNKYKQDIKTRYETQKAKLVKQLSNASDMTEDEIMTVLGYIKIYNSGNIRLSWNK